MRYGEKWPQYAKEWNAMRINKSRTAEFEKIAADILEDKDLYLPIEEATAHDSLGKIGQGVPWYMIALLHLRESNRNFKTYLGNGQPLNRRTTIVPEGRGPFKTFFDGAMDALAIDGLSAVLDWRLEKVLYYQELFNGAGYHLRGLPSPYIWGGTNQQKPGKYVADHKFSATVVDKQPGCAPILATLARLDPSIEFIRET